jgi:site-specific DNA-methyltransferase (adenine-specific)
MAEGKLTGKLDAIHPGDCVAGMNALPAGSVHLAFADPPFNIGYEYDVYEDAKGHREYMDWSRQWIAAVHRVLKPHGTFWLAIGDEYAAELKLLSREVGFHCRSWVVWYYTFGVNCARKYSRSHAHLFHFVKDPRHFTFRSDELENRIPSARQLVYADHRANPRGRLPDDTWILRPQDLAECFTPSEDTWYFPRVAGTFKERAGFHGCQMPEQLLGRIIRACSQDHEIVLDPFSGSATTLAVAKKLGRHFLGFELSEEYVLRGTQRLDNVRRGDPLEGAPEPTVSAPATPGGNGSRRRGKVQLAENGRTREPATPLDARVKLDRMLQEGLIEAFRSVYSGYSLDRVVADPDLNAELIEACRRLGLPGDARSWNRGLFRLRKAGALAGIPTQERTEVSWADCDPYIFASEIAWRQMLDRGCESLDEVLCDPVLARHFDASAREYAPGFTSLDYRWAALKLRKEVKFARARAASLTPLRLGQPVRLRELGGKSVPDQPGVYLVAGPQHRDALYAGQTLDLRRRFHDQFAARLLKHWTPHGEHELFVYLAALDAAPVELLAYQSLLVQEFRPALNYCPEVRPDASCSATVATEASSAKIRPRVRRQAKAVEVGARPR